jgi:tetratricopeptide (TPR) repeat protein
MAEERGDLEQAIEAYEQVSGGDHVLDAQLRLAELWGRLGQIQRGREHLQRLRKKNPSMAVELYEGEARMLRRLGENEAAIAVYEQGLKEFPDNRDLKYGRALLGEKLNRLDILEQELREILGKNPDDVHALNALGYTLADRTERLDEALGYIQRAYAMKPDEPAILDSMGWIHYRLGKLDVAVDYLRKALKALFDPEIAAHLGEVLWVKGEKDEAREVWQRASKAFPDNDILNNVIERFQP